MPEVDISPMVDALVEVMAVLLTTLMLIINTTLGRLWDFIVRMLSINHLGESPAVVIITMGLAFCIYLYVLKFWT